MNFNNTGGDCSLRKLLLDLKITKQSLESYLGELADCISPIYPDLLKKNIAAALGNVDDFAKLIQEVITNTKKTPTLPSQHKQYPHQGDVSLDGFWKFYEDKITKLDADSEKKLHLLVLIDAYFTIKPTATKQEKIDELIKALNENQKDREKLLTIAQLSYDHIIQQIGAILLDSDDSL